MSISLLVRTAAPSVTSRIRVVEQPGLSWSITAMPVAPRLAVTMR